MGRAYLNNYSTTITTASVGTGDTSFDVTTAPAALAAGDYYIATLTDDLINPTKTEVIKVTGIATNTLTVVRAQEGTTAQTWVLDDKIEIRVTANSFGGDPNNWTTSQVGSTQVNAAATGNVTLDFAAYNNFILTLTGNLTLDNPTTEQVGQSGFICFKQDATGSRTLTLGTQFLNAGGTAPTLSTAANAVDVLGYCVVGDGQILLGSALLEFS